MTKEKQEDCCGAEKQKEGIVLREPYVYLASCRDYYNRHDALGCYTTFEAAKMEVLEHARTRNIEIIEWYRSSTAEMRGTNPIMLESAHYIIRRLRVEEKDMYSFHHIRIG